MKAKKLIAAATAVCLCAGSAFSLTGCHEHEYDWTVTTPAGCYTEGEETGVCSCGDTQTRIVEAGHKYEWKVVKMPSDYAEGKAEKICEYDTARDHVIEETMPSFERSAASASKYESLSKDGHITSFTYKCDDGETISATTIANVEDAIALGMENKSAVVSGNIELYHDYKVYETQSRGNITYEFGDNYTHVIDNVTNGRETFYELNEDGSMFAVGLEWKTLAELADPSNENSAVIKHNYQEPLNDRDATADMMGGFGFNFIWLNGDQRSFGVENFISYIYNEYYEINANNDRSASIETLADGSLRFSFYVSVLNNLTSQNYHMVNVSFTLDENYVIKTAEIKNRTWINPVIDPATGIYVAPKGDYKVMDQYSVVQQTEREEGAAVPENPYKYNDMLFTSYDIVKPDGSIVQENEEITVNANELIIFDLKNFAPSTYNLNFDPITVTLTDANNPEIVKACIDNSVKLTDGDIMTMVSQKVAYDEDKDKVQIGHTFQIKSLLAGEYNLNIKSAKTEKNVKLTVDTIAPAANTFSTSVGRYDPTKRNWNFDDWNNEFEVYLGHPLYFTSYVPHPLYEEAGFTVDGVDESTITDDVLESVKVKKFVATETGEYQIILKNLKDPDITATLKVTVKPVPAMSDLLTDEYFNVDSGVKLSFAPSAEGATSGTATYTFKDGSKEIFEYSYDEETDKISLTVNGTPKFKNYELYFDDDYNLFFKYENVFGTTTRIYLYKEVPNRIIGKYKITQSDADALKLEVNIEGDYVITSSITGAYYAIYDVKTDRVIPYETIEKDENGEDVVVKKENRNVDGKPVHLEVGQYIKVWCIKLDGAIAEYVVKLADV